MGSTCSCDTGPVVSFHDPDSRRKCHSVRGCGGLVVVSRRFSATGRHIHRHPNESSGGIVTADQTTQRTLKDSLLLGVSNASRQHDWLQEVAAHEDMASDPTQLSPDMSGPDPFRCMSTGPPSEVILSTSRPPTHSYVANTTIIQNLSGSSMATLQARTMSLSPTSAIQRTGGGNKGSFHNTVNACYHGRPHGVSNPLEDTQARLTATPTTNGANLTGSASQQSPSTAAHVAPVANYPRVTLAPDIDAFDESTSFEDRPSPFNPLWMTDDMAKRLSAEHCTRGGSGGGIFHI